MVLNLTMDNNQGPRKMVGRRQDLGEVVVHGQDLARPVECESVMESVRDSVRVSERV